MFSAVTAVTAQLLIVVNNVSINCDTVTAVTAADALLSFCNIVVTAVRLQELQYIVTATAVVAVTGLL
jgi:hypothetical protein